MLPLLVGLGVDELSVSPARIPATRRMIRSLSVQRATASRSPMRSRRRTADEVAAVSRAALEAGSGQGLEQSATASRASEAPSPLRSDLDLGAARRTQRQHLKDALGVGLATERCAA